MVIIVGLIIVTFDLGQYNEKDQRKKKKRVQWNNDDNNQSV